MSTHRHDILRTRGHVHIEEGDNDQGLGQRWRLEPNQVCVTPRLVNHRTLDDRVPIVKCK